jgi:hypothetical protein
MVKMSPINSAAWSTEPKGDLKVLAAPYHMPALDEIVIKVRIYSQAFDKTFMY